MTPSDAARYQVAITEAAKWRAMAIAADEERRKLHQALGLHPPLPLRPSHDADDITDLEVRGG